jgi:hypothetical protein
MKQLLCRSLGSLATGLLLTVSLSFAGEHAFVGAKKCKTCHLKEYNSWAQTKMAKAFELLKPGVRAEAKKAAKLDPNKDYTTDAECVGCHVTGHGKAGGFVDLTTTPDLVGAQCEQCHGAGATYIEKRYMSLQNKEYKKADLVAVGLVGEITKAQCENCHNSRSPFYKQFDFAARVNEGTHEKFPLKYKH